MSTRLDNLSPDAKREIIQSIADTYAALARYVEKSAGAPAFDTDALLATEAKPPEPVSLESKSVEAIVDAKLASLPHRKSVLWVEDEPDVQVIEGRNWFDRQLRVQ